MSRGPSDRNKGPSGQPRRVLGYVRCSSPGQVLDGETLERQREKILDYARFHNLPEVEIISDEGLSGYKSRNRPGYQRLLHLCKCREVGTIIVYDLSRISRRVTDTLSFIEDIVEKFQIEFISIREQIDTSTPSGRAFIAIAAVFSQLYRDEISFKTKAAMLHMQEKHEFTGGTLAFGYIFAPNSNETLHRHPTEDVAIAFMLEMHGNGYGYRAIAKELQMRGTLTKKGHSQWHPKVVRQIIKRAFRMKARQR